MNLVHRLRVALLVLPMVLVGGCSSLLNVKAQPFTTYSPSFSAAPSAGPRVDWQLIVETPLASATLDTTRMLAMPSPGVLEVFPAARWRDTTPALLRSLVVEGFEQSGRIVGIGSAQSGLRADFALAIDLRDFQLEVHAGGAQAVVRFQANLLDYTGNRMLATRSFSAEAPSAGTDSASAFGAFEHALNTVIPELIEWTFREGNAARAAATTAH